MKDKISAEELLLEMKASFTQELPIAPPLSRLMVLKKQVEYKDFGSLHFKGSFQPGIVLKIALFKSSQKKLFRERPDTFIIARAHKGKRVNHLDLFGYTSGAFFEIDYYEWEKYLEPLVFKSHLPEIKPSKEIIRSKLDLLKNEWENLVGQEMSTNMRPLKFSGKKFKKLVIKVVDENIKPSWGDWDSNKHDYYNSFSLFRRKINEAISPISIDHIHFRF